MARLSFSNFSMITGVGSSNVSEVQYFSGSFFRDCNVILYPIPKIYDFIFTDGFEGGAVN
jgi:hypothetical protein